MGRSGTSAWRVVAAGLAVGCVVLAACGSDSGDGSARDTTAATASPAGTVASTEGTDAAATTSATEASIADTADTAAADTGVADTAATDVTDMSPPPDSGPIDPSGTVEDRPLPPGAERLHFEVGPITVQPGQNNIDYSTGAVPAPDVDGYIVGIAPNLHLADGSIPGVDVIHLHHGVWLNASARDATSPVLPERFFAAGEEKTTMLLPEGYGYEYTAGDRWILNYMIHNLFPIEEQIWITYDLDFIPATDPAAANIQPARPVWTDVQNGSVYPVFDVIRGDGQDGLYTYPDDAENPYGTEAPKNQWVVDRDGVLLATAGHLHPGGLHTDLWLTRDGQTTRLFQSVAHYWEPAGAVSWDVAMTATPEDWRVQVRAGDVLSTSATYDSERASWYESMGIMVVWMADTTVPGDTAPDPFDTAVDVPGQLTHGHLAENDNHGGEPDASYLNLLQAPSEPASPTIDITGYVYAQGDMLAGDGVPTVAPGGTITYNNVDAPLNNGVWHTITACKAPCNQATGIAYPLADADIPFDSGQLGAVGPPTAGRVTWNTPTDLPDGTYTYFCRIHPAMRGAFRVESTP